MTSIRPCVDAFGARRSRVPRARLATTGLDPDDARVRDEKIVEGYTD
jgi:hypothetical protein